MWCTLVYICVTSIPLSHIPLPPTHPSHLSHHSHSALRYTHFQVIQDRHLPFARPVALVCALNQHHIAPTGTDGGLGSSGDTVSGGGIGGGVGRGAVKVRDDGESVDLVVRDK